MRLFLLALAATLAGCTASGGSPGTPPVPPFDGKVPPATCLPPVQLRDTSSPTAVVGTGSAASCTESTLRAAVQQVNAAGGGIITFDCGAAPATITVGSQIVFTRETVLDGGGLVTLSGGDSSRILYLDSGYDQATPRLWVQRLTFQSGRSALEAGGDTASGGAAIYRDGGSLTVVNCAFLGNHAPSTGQDLAGGAIYAFGGGDTVVLGSTFVGNSASDGGAIGSLNGHLTVVNSTFTDNHALGTGGNPGNGGCGGAIYQDGADETTTLCGVAIRNNGAGAIGGGMFRVSNLDNGSMSLDLSSVDANTVTASGGGNAGGLYLQGLALTVTRSTISRNSAYYAGGMWISKGTLQLADSTIAGNTATGSNGGGLWLSYSPRGTILNCTIADNHAPGGSAGAIFNAGPKVAGQPVLLNTIVSGNDARWSDACQEVAGQELGDGGGNLEWTTDGTRCAAAATVADPLLSALGDQGGPTETVLPGATSPARQLAKSSCPAVDQRNEPRGTPCTTGAVEVP
jgi:parallel beta-helix repeat protein